MRDACSTLICLYRNCAIALALFGVFGGEARAENGGFEPELNWRAMPLTEGDWRYISMNNAAIALFSRLDTTPVIAISCDITRREIWIMRALSKPSQTTLPSDMLMHITTDAQSAVLAASPADKPLPGVGVQLSPTDPLLDSIAFSAGRFAVEVSDNEALYLPAWAEIARVIEDCR